MFAAGAPRPKLYRRDRAAPRRRGGMHRAPSTRMWPGLLSPVSALVFAISGALGRSPARDPGDPLGQLRRADATIEAALRRRVPDWSPEAEMARARVNAVLQGMLDNERIARIALGGDWDGLTDGQRATFVRKLGALTEDSFVSALTRWAAHLRFDSETVNGARASVMVTAIPAGRAADAGGRRLEYLLCADTGRWLVYDVVVDGVSLVDGYRDQFTRMMRRGGFEEVMARLDRKLARLQRD